jgi:hypothetical protein
MKQDPQPGDIISSKAFAYGRKNSTNNVIIVDGETKSHPVTSYLAEEERVRLAAKTGKIPPKTRVKEQGAYDKSRGKAKFKVVFANWSGGGYGHGPRIPWWPCYRP